MLRQIAIIWSVDDVQIERPDLNDEQCMVVLRKVKDSHDANYGVTWYILKCWADKLYPEN